VEVGGPAGGTAMKYIATADGQEYEIRILPDGRIVADGEELSASLESIDGRALFSLIIDDASYEVFVERRDRVYFVTVAGDRYEVRVEDERMKLLRERAGAVQEEVREAAVKAPMPGLVVDVIVQEGQEVAAGDGVVILEAMKMENEIRSPQAGRVRSIRVSPGQTVNQGDTMLEIGRDSHVDPEQYEE
jgi:biotin carboxyl carrier protein